MASIEHVQQEAAVSGQEATIAAAKTDIDANIAAEKTAEANVAKAKADLQQKRLDWEREQPLFEAGIVAKSDFDAKKAAYDTDVATVDQAIAALNQAKAQTDSLRGHLKTQVANLRANQNMLDLTIAVAPFDAVVTNMPVREGETVVEGIEGYEGSTLMTLADMSVITAEVKVDETDIVNVKIGQPADVTVDALPGKVFKGHVTLVGDQALLRSTGMAKITTAHKPNVLSLPIQALTMVDPKADENKSGVQAASTSSAPAAKSVPVQGVYVVDKDKGGKLRAKFVPVTTGITGATDIEVLSGLGENQEIVIGPYKTLRGLKSNALVKRDTAKPPTPGGSS